MMELYLIAGSLGYVIGAVSGYYVRQIFAILRKINRWIHGSTKAI